MLKVDILNIMGPSIVLAATLWGRLPHRARADHRVRRRDRSSSSGRRRSFARPNRWRSLSDSLEAYLRPIPNLTNFTFFPWMAFVTAGAITGVILDAARSPEADRRVNLGFGVARAWLIAFAAYKASFLPPLGVQSSFWTTSASFFFIRLGADDRGPRAWPTCGSSAPDRRAGAVEPAPAARAVLAVRLLDSRRAGLRR